MPKSLLACATLIGTIIGAGVFAIPYVFSQSGVITCLVYFLVVSITVILLHLFFGEIVLRTKEESRLSGFAERYLGKKAKVLVGLALIVGTVGSLLVYIILSGQFLNLIFPNWLSVFQLSLLTWLVLSFLVFCGTRSIARLEFLLASALFLAAAVVIVFCLPKIQLHNFSLFNPAKLFLPFGVFMFSLVGWSAVPESEDILPNKKQLKSVIVISLVVCAIFYIIFGLVVSGVTGKLTTPEAFEGLVPFLGRKIIVLAGIFGFLAVATSFLTIANYLKNTFHFDYKVPRLAAFFLACFTPLALFMAGLRGFVALVSGLGAFIGLIEGVSIVLIWQKAKKQGTRVPEYSLRLPRYAPYLVIAVLFLGSVFQFFYK